MLNLIMILLLILSFYLGITDIRFKQRKAGFMAFVTLIPFLIGVSYQWLGAYFLILLLVLVNLYLIYLRKFRGVR